MADKIEIWYTPTLAATQHARLVEARAFDPTCDPPSVYTMPDGALVVAARMAREPQRGGYQYRVDFVDLDD